MVRFLVRVSPIDLPDDQRLLSSLLLSYVAVSGQILPHQKGVEMQQLSYHENKEHAENDVDYAIGASLFLSEKLGGSFLQDS